MQGMATKRLRARLAEGDGWTALRLDGVIDEHSGLGEVFQGLTGGAAVLVLDLGGVQRINSVGVRDWVNALRDVRGRYPHVVLTDCPPPIMNEVNLVKNFAEGALIHSFQAPYYCDRCGLEATHELNARDMLQRNIRVAPAFPCEKPACANALDDAEETYFAFFDDQRGMAAPDGLSDAVAEARAALARTTETITPDAAAAGQQSSPATRPSLEALGRRDAASAVPPDGPARALPDAAAASTPTRERGGDWIFVAAILAMIAVLAVLVFMIADLE